MVIPLWVLHLGEHVASGEGIPQGMAVVRAMRAERARTRDGKCMVGQDWFGRCWWIERKLREGVGGFYVVCEGFDGRGIERRGRCY